MEIISSNLLRHKAKSCTQILHVTQRLLQVRTELLLLFTIVAAVE